MMERILIQMITGTTHDFIGEHLPDMEKPNWHYYRLQDGSLLHLRKEHMVSVLSKECGSEEGI